MTDTRQPITDDAAIEQIKLALEVNTLTDAIRRIADLQNQLETLKDWKTNEDAKPAPLLTITASGQIIIRPDVTLRGLMQMIEALQNMRLAGQ